MQTKFMDERDIRLGKPDLIVIKIEQKTMYRRKFRYLNYLSKILKIIIIGVRIQIMDYLTSNVVACR